MEDKSPSPGMIWSAWQKNAFRFFFLFIGSTSFFAYNIIIFIFPLDIYLGAKVLSVFSRPIFWLDHHFYHFGFDPKKHGTFLGDGPFGWALLVTLFFLSLLGTIIWAWRDKRKNNYNRLHYWFRTYLAYYLFIAVIGYAIEKIIPVQMSFPDVDTMLSPVGQQGGQDMVWIFIGSNRPYSMFTGICEMLGSVLILSRRTRVFGSLFMTTVLVNVVCLNLFYNIIVKLLCLQLLLTALFLLAPYIPRLFQFFYNLQPVSLAEKTYRFSKSWKNWLMIALLIFPALATFITIKDSIRWWQHGEWSRKNEKLYNADIFIRGADTLPPLLTDTLRWKRFAFTGYGKYKKCIIYSMKDAGDYYDYNVDSVKKTITLHDNPDTLSWHVFHYNYPTAGKYELIGKWKGHPITVIMKNSPIDSLFLMAREKITWVHDF